jgi:hypothetical protein
MNKIKILCLSLWYPLSMSRYFEKAFRHHPNVDFKTTGVFTGSWIPWLGGLNLPEKYALPPDVPLPFNPSVGQVSYDLVKAQLGDWKPDIVLSIDAGINWSSKPSDGLVATIATDPHALNYDHQRRISDKFFNMQMYYSETGDIYLPYAYSKYDVYPDDTVHKDLDAVLIGMPYQQREQWKNELVKRGVNVYMENGAVFDEARALYNRGRIGLNWSSLNDLNCRAFELPAMKLYPVMNRVFDMDKFGFFDHCGIFSGLNEAIEMVMWAKDHPDLARDRAERAYQEVLPHTYDARVEEFLQECGYA